MFFDVGFDARLDRATHCRPVAAIGRKKERLGRHFVRAELDRARIVEGDASAALLFRYSFGVAGPYDNLAHITGVALERVRGERSARLDPDNERIFGLHLAD